jgi:hypothetical protein
VIGRHKEIIGLQTKRFGMRAETKVGEMKTITREKLIIDFQFNMQPEKVLHWL